MYMFRELAAFVAVLGFIGICVATPINPGPTYVTTNSSAAYIKGTNIVEIRVDGMTDDNTSIPENLSSGTGGGVNISVKPQTGSGWYVTNASMTWDATDSRWEYNYTVGAGNASDWYNIQLHAENNMSEDDRDLYEGVFLVEGSSDTHGGMGNTGPSDPWTPPQYHTEEQRQETVQRKKNTGTGLLLFGIGGAGAMFVLKKAGALASLGL
jgi:hypothetical protein